MAVTITGNMVRGGSPLSDNRYHPAATTIDRPIFFESDFVGVGGRTVVDAALANETDPFGYFYSTATAADGVWLVSHDAVDAATQLPTIQTGTGGANGVVAMTTDATSGERISMQLNGAAFHCTAGYEMIFKTRVKFTNTTQDAFIGLAVTGATDPHASRPAGFMAFTLTGDADIEYATGDAGSATASVDSTANLTADTWVILSMYYDGVDGIGFYVGGTEMAEATLTIPTGLVLSPVFCVESNGAAEALFVDYVFCAVGRLVA